MILRALAALGLASLAFALWLHTEPLERAARRGWRRFTTRKD